MSGSVSKGALIAAVKANNLAKVKELCSKSSVDVNEVDDYNETPLHYAASHYWEILEHLLTVPGIEVNKTETSTGTTALHFAAAYNNLQGVQLLCGCEAVDVNCRDNDGSTPLLLAASCGHSEVVHLLISLSRVDVNAVDDEGETALDMAVGMNRQRCVELLRDAVTT